ncbi:MAG: class I SAM-dependent methyltransferase [Alphaproteobacteria bacterium]|nr:class I SAM-dependent methyltransferase [Alphaproteobacteria bacterium]
MNYPASQQQYDIYWRKLRASAKDHPANRFRYHLILEVLRNEAADAKTILDFGCGDGVLLEKIRASFPHVQLYGCDISAEQIEQNRKVLPGIEFFQADAASQDLALQVKTHSLPKFDLIISSEVVEHIQDDRTFLFNAVNLLKSGGLFLVTTQSGPRYRMDTEVLGHLRHYRLADFRKMVEGAGLRVVRDASCGFPVLTLQKKLVELFFGLVMRQLSPGDAQGPGHAHHSSDEGAPRVVGMIRSAIVKAIMDAMYWAMRVSPKLGGPQLFVLAEKPDRPS